MPPPDRIRAFERVWAGVIFLGLLLFLATLAIDEWYGAAAVDQYVFPLVGVATVALGGLIVRYRALVGHVHDRYLHRYPFLRLVSWKYSAHPAFITLIGLLFVGFGLLVLWGRFGG